VCCSDCAGSTTTCRLVSCAFSILPGSSFSEVSMSFWVGYVSAPVPWVPAAAHLLFARVAVGALFLDLHLPFHTHAVRTGALLLTYGRNSSAQASNSRLCRCMNEGPPDMMDKDWTFTGWEMITGLAADLPFLLDSSRPRQGASLPLRSVCPRQASLTFCASPDLSYASRTFRFSTRENVRLSGVVQFSFFSPFFAFL